MIKQLLCSLGIEVQVVIIAIVVIHSRAPVATS